MREQKLLEQFNLRSRLRFNTEAGRIWLDDNRMLLIHAIALGTLRQELFASLGARRAQESLLRMGFVSGQHDADLAVKLTGEAPDSDLYKIGPELHAFEGLVKPTFTRLEVDWEKGTFLGEVDWQHSWEAEAHLAHFGPSEEPACWTLVGYASGYTSRFFKRFVVFRETQCRAQGHERCRIVGKPAEAWNDDPYLRHFLGEQDDSPMRAIEEELAQMRGARPDPCSQGNLVGNSPAFRAAFHLLSVAASSPINVLLLGETGVGKEMFARWLHENSPRAQNSFIAINCGAIPHDLIEAELFGVRKGAFTGAHESRPGRFERADGGTLFLDEVGELSPAAQVKLLRALQTGEVERLGDDQMRKVQVRLIAATNVNLQQAVAEGRFRADLFYRLATYPIVIPPLRERKSDIPLLATALIAKYSVAYGRHGLRLSDAALATLLAHAWPGNVRELENLIERAVLLAPDNGEIDVPQLFPQQPGSAGRADEAAEPALSEDARAHEAPLCDALLQGSFDLESHVDQLVALAVRRAGGNLTHAARSLGITRRQLAYRLKRSLGEQTAGEESAQREG